MNGDQRGVGLAIVRVVDVDDVLPLVVVDDVHDGLVVVGPQAQRVIRRSRCGRQNLLGCFFFVSASQGHFDSHHSSKT